MIRTLVFSAAALAFTAALASCATGGGETSNEIEEAARAECRVQGSPDNAPVYDEQCMRRTRDAILAAREYDPDANRPRPQTPRPSASRPRGREPERANGPTSRY